MTPTFNMSSPREVPFGITLRKTPYKVNSSHVYFGTSIDCIIKRHATMTGGKGVVESRDYDTLSLTELSWYVEGNVVAPTLRNFTVDGNGGLTDYTLNPANPAPTVLAHGIKLWALSPIIEGVTVYDCAGDGINLRSGGNLLDSYNLHNRTKARICGNTIQRNLNGIVSNLSEAFICFNEIVGARGIGLHLKSTGSQCIGNHIYGADIATQVGVPETGYENHFEGHQTADARIGFLNYGPGTSCKSMLKIYNCTECCLQTYSSMQAEGLVITAGGTVRGIKLGDNASGTKFGGEVNMSGSAVGMEFVAGTGHSDRVKLTNLDFNGGSKSILCYQPVNRNIWKNLLLTDNNLDLQAFGTDNHIEAFGNGTITNNTGSALDASNKIWLNGTQLSL